MERRTLLAVFGGALVVGTGWTLLGSNDSSPLPSVGVANAQSADVDTSVVRDMALGDENAPVTVIEYASFTCPHCASFHKGTFGEIKANYIETGKVRFIHREVYFDRYGLWAGMVARCGGPERYFGIADIIYRTQRDWTASNDPSVVAENLRRIGRTAGLTDAELDACMTDQAMATAMITRFEETTAADGINSTPSFMIDGQKRGNMNYADFSKVLDDLLAQG